MNATNNTSIRSVDLPESAFARAHSLEMLSMLVNVGKECGLVAWIHIWARTSQDNYNVR